MGSAFFCPGWLGGWLVIGYNEKMNKWRLIIDGPQTGEYNMAADAYLLHASEDEGGYPTVRIYDWDRPTITIGYHQQFEKALDVSRLGETPVIRRITGGRALFHNDQSLTYAVAGNFVRSGELGRTIRDSYQEISHAILRFYNSIGIKARMSQRDRPVSLSLNRALQKDCFSAVSRWEITLNGRKLAAGSQRRTRTTMMQHGVILLSPASGHPALVDSLQVDDSQHDPLCALSRSALVAELHESFSRQFGTEMDKRPLDSHELEIISRRKESFRNLN